MIGLGRPDPGRALAPGSAAVRSAFDPIACLRADDR